MSDASLQTYHRVRVDSFPSGPFVDAVLDYSPALISRVGKGWGCLTYDRGTSCLTFRAPGDACCGPEVLVNCDGNYRLVSGSERFWIVIQVDISDLDSVDTETRNHPRFVSRHVWIEHFVPRNERVRDLNASSAETPVVTTPTPKPVTTLVPMDDRRSANMVDELQRGIDNIKSDQRHLTAFAFVAVFTDGTARFVHNSGPSNIGGLALIGGVQKLGDIVQRDETTVPVGVE